MKTIKTLTILALALLASTAMAGTQIANFQATAKINAACYLSMNDFNFGSIQFKSDSSALSQLKVHAILVLPQLELSTPEPAAHSIDT